MTKYEVDVTKTLIVNLFAGPCAGKSTVAADVFSTLKKSGIEIEQITEYAKQLTWQKHYNVLYNQPYVFAKQLNSVYRVAGQVDVIVTDSPFILSGIYGGFGCTPSFVPWIMEVHHLFRNLNIFLDLVNIPYNPVHKIAPWRIRIMHVNC